MKQLHYLLLLLVLVCTACNNQNKEERHSGFTKLMAKADNAGFKPGDREKYLDSAYNDLSGNRNDSVFRYSLRRVALSYYDLGNYDKAIAVSHKVYNSGKVAGDSLSQGKARYFAALSFYQKGNRDSALFYFRGAEKILRSISNPDLPQVLLYKAYVYYDVGEYAFAESEASIALAGLEKQNDNYKKFQCIVLIALCLNDQGFTNEAIVYYKKALAQIEELRKEGYDNETLESFLISIYSNMGMVYAKMEDYEKAIKEYNKALKSPVLKMNPLWEPEILNNKAFALFSMDKKDGVESMLFKALRISDSLKIKQQLAATSLNIGLFYSKYADTVTSITYLKKAYNESRAIKSNKTRLNALKELMAIDPVKGMVYSKEYMRVDDSLQKVALQNRNKFARIEYETDQLQDEKDALVRKNSFIIGISVLILLFVAAIFIIYYLNSRNKELLLIQEQQKANEEIYQLMLEQQERVESARSEEKNRIAMELHDGILNNIYAVRLNLEFSNRKTDDQSIEKRKEFIKELQGVEAEIRSVSHDLSRSARFVQGKDFAAMLRFLVDTQKNTFGTHFTVHIDESIDWDYIPNTHKVNVYRIIQEALQNINKYSKAANAMVKICANERNLTVTVNDDGVGFDAKKAAAGIGLKNFKKRTEAINGLLGIQSFEGKGTEIKVEFSI